jgi:hypothetical protein
MKASWADLKDVLPDGLQVYVKKMHCNKPIERLYYYAANYDDIINFVSTVLGMLIHGHLQSHSILNVKTVKTKNIHQMPSQKKLNYVFISFFHAIFNG